MSSLRSSCLLRYSCIELQFFRLRWPIFVRAMSGVCHLILSFKILPGILKMVIFLHLPPDGEVDLFWLKGQCESDPFIIIFAFFNIKFEMDDVSLQGVSVNGDAAGSGDLCIHTHSLFLGLWNLVVVSVGLCEDLLKLLLLLLLS